MSIQPIILNGHASGSNPWKVILLLEELKIPYEHKKWKFEDLKKPPFESLNPNGRTPAIEDPNTGIVLWESGAILEYLIETYDKDHTLTYTSFPEKFQLKQWLHFQMSGQGPYFGQAYWWIHFFPGGFEPARERYVNEVKRVAGVFDKHFAATGSEYLVGDKYTYADLAFIPWFGIAFGQGWLEHDGSAFSNWFKRITERPVSVKVLAAKEESSRAA